jgi:hypothetical protein
VVKAGRKVVGMVVVRKSGKAVDFFLKLHPRMWS